MLDMKGSERAQPTGSQNVRQLFLSGSVFTWGALATPGNTGQSLETLWVVTAEGQVLWVDRAQDAAKYSAACRSGPQ